jgi:hypothetical protein
MDLVDRLWATNDWIMHRLPGGAGLVQPRHAINLHKLSVGPLVLCLIFATGNFTLTAWLYLALHGLYGVMWVAKDVAFGDRAVCLKPPTLRPSGAVAASAR